MNNSQENLPELVTSLARLYEARATAYRPLTVEPDAKRVCAALEDYIVEEIERRRRQAILAGLPEA